MTAFGALTDKPWLTPGLDASAPDRPEERWDRGVGLGLFLLVVTVIFGLVTSAYFMRMGHHLRDGEISDWRTMREPPLLWINTGVLVVSSLAFRAAEQSGRAADSVAMRRYLLVGGLLGLAFLGGQLLLWRSFGDWSYALLYSGSICRPGDPLFTFPFPSTILGNPALAFFYLISGLHGVHIVGGLVAWALAARRIAGGAPSAATTRAVQLCARYWHFLLLIWALMMALFVAT